ncbi:MAG TPA: hypothetical protein VE084_00500 [Burkholderiaceae bacterium]|nr:hypothetical protein [Burkholderiaceae bacterium]
MTNVFGSPEKVGRRNRLFQIGVEALQRDGWTVERIQGAGKSSVRRIRKEGQSRIVSIRTTQDTYIAFPRNDKDTAWVTLAEVDAVVAVSVDDAADPRYALVHLVDGDEMRDRFDRAYAARLAAGHSIPVGRGVWVPLYIPDAAEPASHVGGGAGLAHPPIARVPLAPEDLEEADATQASEPPPTPPQPDAVAQPAPAAQEEPPLTIAEAKRRLALSLGVDASSIKITIEA